MPNLTVSTGAEGYIVTLDSTQTVEGFGGTLAEALEDLAPLPLPAIPADRHVANAGPRPRLQPHRARAGQARVSVSSLLTLPRISRVFSVPSRRRCDDHSKAGIQPRNLSEKKDDEQRPSSCLDHRSILELDRFRGRRGRSRPALT